MSDNFYGSPISSKANIMIIIIVFSNLGFAVEISLITLVHIFKDVNLLICYMHTYIIIYATIFMVYVYIN